MSDIDALRAENERLRDLLNDNGIDPDPTPPEPPQFGPQTLWQWRMQAICSTAVRQFVEGKMRHLADAKLVTESQRGDMLKIRVPTDFVVGAVR